MQQILLLQRINKHKNLDHHSIKEKGSINLADQGCAK